MYKALLMLTAAGALAGCSSGTAAGIPWPGRDGSVVVVDDDERDRDDRDRDDRRRGRSIGNVPRGHYPPPGECRVWYVGRPAGQQPPPARCERLVGRVPYGAFLLYNGKSWDTEYDWRNHARRYPRSVPDAVLRIMNSLTRN